MLAHSLDTCSLTTCVSINNLGRAGVSRFDALTILRGSFPARTFHPFSSVSIHSISSRGLTHGTLSTNVFLCRRPESVQCDLLWSNAFDHIIISMLYFSSEDGQHLRDEDASI